MTLVAVSGANGFTGRYVCEELQRRKIPFVALLRPGNDDSWMSARNFQVRYADLEDVHQLAQQLYGCSALINVASIGFGAAPSILQSCHRAGIRRTVFVSTTAIFTQLNAASKIVRKAAEAAIIDSGLEATIIRPTMIYGSPGDRNMIRLVRFVNRFPIVPIFGNGKSLQQPVYVEDVAWSIVQSLESPATINRQFNVSGANPVTYNEVVDLTSQALNRHVIKLHIPAKPVISFLEFIERLGFKAPVKAEQIRRLNEDKSFSHADAAETFGYNPIDFREGISREVHAFWAFSGQIGLQIQNYRFNQ